MISRRDRHEKANRDNVLSLPRADFGNLVCFENSVDDERSWHFLYLDPEVMLIGN